MQISIDTSRDSKEDILKAISLLHSIIGEHPTTVQSLFDSPQSQPSPQGSVFGNFFDSMDKTPATQQTPLPVKKESQPKIEWY